MYALIWPFNMITLSTNFTYLRFFTNLGVEFNFVLNTSRRLNVNTRNEYGILTISLFLFARNELAVSVVRNTQLVQ